LLYCSTILKITWVMVSILSFCLLWNSICLDCSVVSFWKISISFNFSRISLSNSVSFSSEHILSWYCSSHFKHLSFKLLFSSYSILNDKKSCLQKNRFPIPFPCWIKSYKSAILLYNLSNLKWLLYIFSHVLMITL
jgi:hypothetical protein